MLNRGRYIIQVLLILSLETFFVKETVCQTQIPTSFGALSFSTSPTTAEIRMHLVDSTIEYKAIYVVVKVANSTIDNFNFLINPAAFNRHMNFVIFQRDESEILISLFSKKGKPFKLTDDEQTGVTLYVRCNPNDNNNLLWSVADYGDLRYSQGNTSYVTNKMDQLINNAFLSVYPNPFNGNPRIYVAVETEQLLEIRLFDVLGRELQRNVVNTNLQSKIFETDLKMDYLASGTYYLRLYVGSKKIPSQAFKIVKIN